MSDLHGASSVIAVNITDIIARLRAKARTAGIDLSQPFFFPPEHERFSQIITEFKQEREARIARLRRNKNKLRRHRALMNRQDIKAVARLRVLNSPGNINRSQPAPTVNGSVSTVSERTQSDLKTKSKSKSVISAGAQLIVWSARRYLKAKTPLPMTSVSSVSAALGLNFKWAGTARTPPPPAGCRITRTQLV